MKRVMLLTCSVAAVAAWQARADDRTISTATTVAVSTASAANATPGNITITPTGSVAVTTTGAAVTLNSNNVVLNNGNISNSSGNGAIGVNIISTGGITGAFTNAGTISIPAAGSPFTSTGQFGVLLNGNATFTGNLTTAAGSTLTVSGVSPTAFAVEAPVTGNLTLGGTEKATGTGAVGVLVSSPVTGAFVNTGAISTIPEGNSTTILNISPGSALEIGSSITGGVLNTATGNISTLGSAPALVISPTIGSVSAILTLAPVSDVANPGYGLLNRGTITAIGTQPGVSTLAVQLGASVGITSGLATNLSGGLYNNGSITATATSDNGNATSSAASASNATAIVLGYGASMGNLTNDTLGTISATTGGPLGGNATAITIQSGVTLGNLTSPGTLTNFGTIAAHAVTTDSTIASLAAYAIQDKSGTLGNITNAGTISATASALATGTQVTVAADLSARSGNTTFINTGTVIGDILFGTSTNNQLTITGAAASVTGRIHAIGAVNVTVTGGTLATSSATTVGTLTVDPSSTLNLDIGQSTTVVSANGAGNFDAASHLVLTPISLLASSGTITLVHSNTGLTFGNLTATTATAALPFLYTGNVTLSPDTKTLALHYALKTPAALGLTGNAAIIFQPAIAAAIQDNQLSVALGALSSSAAVQSAAEEFLPIISNAPRRMAETITDSSTGAVGLRQRTLLLNGSPEADGAFWGQGFYNMFSDNGSSGYDAHGHGGVVGVDYSQAMKGHVGAALTVFEGTSSASAPATSKVDVQWIDASIYMGLRSDNYFFDGQFNVAGAKLNGQRDVDVASIARTAKTNGSTAFLVSQALTGGYIFDMGNWKLAPEASLDVMFLNDSAYHETGGGKGVDLSVSSRNENSLRGFLGVAASGVYEVDAFRIAPQLLAGYSHEFLHPGAINAAFASVPASVFSIPGPSVESSKFVASANVNLSLDNWSLGFVYDISGLSNGLAHTAGATLTARF